MTKEKKRRAIAGTLADPSLPKTPVTIAGKVYNLCFDLGALAEAETAINVDLARAGAASPVNLLYALPVESLANTRIIFAAAVRTFHPELDFEAAKALLSRLEDVYRVCITIRSAWAKAVPEQETTADPRHPGK